VQTCDNGRDGLEQARKAPPQLIVTDLVLGDTDGFALCEQFRQDPRLKAVPIIMVTGTYRRRKTACGARTWAPTPISSSLSPWPSSCRRPQAC